MLTRNEFIADTARRWVEGAVRLLMGAGPESSALAATADKYIRAASVMADVLECNGVAPWREDLQSVPCPHGSPTMCMACLTTAIYDGLQTAKCR